MVTVHCNGQDGGTQEWKQNCQKELWARNLDRRVKENA